MPEELNVKKRGKNATGNAPAGAEDKAASKSRKRRIAFILPHFYPYVGGAEKLFYEMAVQMVKAGYEVRVVAEKVDDEHSGKCRLDGMTVWYCPWKSMFGHPFPRKKDIERHIKWCDIVHTSTFTTSPVVSALARKYHKPSVLTVHEIRGDKWFWSDAWYKACIYWIVEQYTCRQKFDVYHVVSDATKRDFIKFIGNGNIRRVYNATDNEWRDITSDDKAFSLRKYFKVKKDFIFLYYGRPGRTKGIFVYADALKLLKERGIDTSGVKFCFILGKEPAAPRREFLTFLKKNGLKDLVRIRGSVGREELGMCIKQADCVVVPSLTEGFGFSAAEACMTGTPLICSDAGALPEVVSGKCLIFRNRDSEDLADKLESVIRDGERAFIDIPEKVFTHEAMYEGLNEIYDDLLGK